MKKLLSMKHDNSKSAYKHMIETRDIATQLKSLEVENF